jgi:signal peptide peptidase SppA
VSDPYRHLISCALDHPWAITPAMLETVSEVLARKIAGQRLTAEEIQARLQDKAKLPQPDVSGAVAVIPIHGVIVPRGSMLDDVSGATSLDSLSSQLSAAMADEKVGKVLLDIDSPGGSVAGVTEFARQVMKARTKKPIIAHARYTAASAALWIGAAATKFVASPSARVGSLGVYAIHNDLSKALEAMGVKRTFVSSSPAKVEGNETQPLSDAGRAEIQKVVDASAARFRQDVAHGRGTTVENVKASFGEGKMFAADEALSIGMIDEVATFEETVSRLLSTDTRAELRAETPSDQPNDTAQEPSPATAQDPTTARWALDLELSLLEVTL